MKKLLSALLGIFGLFIIPAYAALPTGYTELEYIEGTGTQYITTDITANQDTSAEIKFVPTSVYPSNAVFGARTSKTSDAFNVWLPGVDGGIVSNLGTLGAVTTNTEPILNEVYVMYLSKTRFAVNNLVTNISNVTDFVTPGGIQIFNIYGGAATVSASATSTNRIASGKVYYFKIWQNNTLTHNFIPAKNSSGVVGMYDTVGNRFYTNAGTGEFIAGDPVATCDGTVVNYVSATGTGVQNGTPTPDNPIYPTFYQQGNMVLRKVGNYADSYDATTGKITRRVGVKVLDGTEDWRDGGDIGTDNHRFSLSVGETGDNNADICSHVSIVIQSNTTNQSTRPMIRFNGISMYWYATNNSTTLADFQQWLVQQYAAGTPVTVWYPLAEETTEDWTETSYCETPIKIATTKYNETKFSPLNTALQNAISVVDTVVSNTITQAASIATLQAQKQTRPNDIADDNEKCPAGKKCLLVEDASGVPHWYEITDPFRDFVAPIIANNVAPASTTNSAGYTQLEYIESTGEQYLDLGYAISKTMGFEIKSRCLGVAFVFGGRLSSSSAVSGMNYDATGSRIGIRMGGVMLYDTLVWQEGTDYTVSIQNGNVSIDGRTVSSATYGNDYYTGKAYLFAINNNGHLSTTVYNKNRIYYFKMYDNNTLAQHLVPVKRNIDGAIGMYDTVTKTFFANAGTGTFTAGPVVANDADVPGATWTATWAADATTGVIAGTITGEALCNAVAGTTVGEIATDAQMNSSDWSNNGTYCRCKIDGINTNGSDVDTTTNKWVWLTSTSSCLEKCAYYCSNSTKTATEFRNIMLNTAQ